MASFMPHSPLFSFLTQTRRAVLGRFVTKPGPIVLGNSSADLDSFVSAVVYAYFGHQKPDKRHGMPLLNLASTRADELWRLRPEFGVALRLSVVPPDLETAKTSGESPNNQGKSEREVERHMLESLITIGDIRSTSSSPLSCFFDDQMVIDDNEAFRLYGTGKSLASAGLTLVDHNQISIPLPPSTQTSSVPARRWDPRYADQASPILDAANNFCRKDVFIIVACIDHHADESCVPANAEPRIIKTGIGSCTTLVVDHLRQTGEWEKVLKQEERPELKEKLPAIDGTLETLELAKLSLAAILIDTSNLTAKDKASPLDVDIVSYLENMINDINARKAKNPSPWDRKAFYDEIYNAKANSLDLLTIQEILARDYKTWTETRHDGREVKVGISSSVKSIQCLADWASIQAGTATQSPSPPTTRGSDSSSNPEFETGAALLEECLSFGMSECLDILIIMSAFSNDCTGEFSREIFYLNINPLYQKNGHVIDKPFAEDRAKLVAYILEMFTDKAMSALGLDPWNGDVDENGAWQSMGENRFTALPRDQCPVNPRGAVFTQTKVGMSRKQVAPMIREAMRED